MNRKKMENWINEMVSFGIRRPGQPAGLKAENYIEKQFEKIGLQNVTKQPINITSWDATEWSLKNREGTTISSHYIPYTAFTGADEVKGELLYLREGKLDDLKNVNFKGKIPVVDFNFPMLEGSQLSKLALTVYDPEKRIGNNPLHEATWIRPGWHVYEKAMKQRGR